MKKTIALVGAVLIVMLGAFASPSYATSAGSNCKPAIQFTLMDWPDTASDGSIWAKDTVTRKMTICAVKKPGEGVWTYVSTMNDAGSTFVTTGPKSPKAGVSLVAGIKGQMSGGMIQTFEGPANFAGWDIAKNYLETTKFDGTSIRSGAMLGAAYMGTEGFKLKDATYKWEYKTSCEKLTDNNGKLSGDITKVCPAASTSASASTSVSPSTSVKASSSASVSTSSSPVPSLPVTGPGTTLIATIVFGVGLLAVGIGVLAISRHRKTQFKA